MAALLEGTRVLDAAGGIAGGYTAKLLGDLGAEVIVAEPAGGDPLRRRGTSAAARGALFAFLHGGHRAVLASNEETRDLATSADVALTSADALGASLVELRATNPRLVVVSLSAFGSSVTDAGRPTTEFTLQAQCGSTASRGTRETPPTYAAGDLVEWYAAPYAATAATAARRSARTTGRGAHIDLSLLEVGCLTSQYATVMRQFYGDPPMPARQRIVMTPCVEPSADGWVGFSTITGQQFQDFLALIEAYDLLDDAEMASQPGRLKRADEIIPRIRAWTTAHTTEEIVARASALRIPVSPIGDATSVTGFDQFVERGVYAAHPDGFTAPLPPWRIHGEARDTHRCAPMLGEHQGSTWSPRVAPDVRHEDRARLPLEGVRVVDFTMFWAGPSATHALAALGAEVIKVESVQRPDGMRFTSARPPEVDRWWEWGWLFCGLNANKIGITLDLESEVGRDLALRLVATADVVVENYTPRVMERFGLGWETVRATNSTAVMVRMPGFGLDGPWRDRPGWANTMEQACGLAAISGWPDGPPWIPNGQLDPVAGQHAALLAVAALERRDATGDGVLVELPMVEVGCVIAAEPVIEHSIDGTVRRRAGNRSPWCCPQGVYRAAGKEQWIAVSVATDEQWRSLAHWLDAADWAIAASFDDRRDRHDDIDALITARCAGLDRDTAVEALCTVGVPAAAVTNPTDLDGLAAPVERGFFEAIDHPVTGTARIPTVPWRWTQIDSWLHSPAPTLGEHTDAVLSGLGLDRDTLGRLRAERIIGEAPADVD